MTNKAKRVVRDIQERARCSYSFALFLVRELGYEEVSRRLDDGVTTDALNAAAKEAAKAKATLERDGR